MLFEAKQTGDMIRALQNGNKVKEVIDDCLDKNGKLDEKKAYVKLIDCFNLSIYTAKELFDIKIHEAKEPTVLAKSKLAEYKRKLSKEEID